MLGVRGGFLRRCSIGRVAVVADCLDIHPDNLKAVRFVLREILKRPKNEKPFVLIPVGYPTEDAKIPDISRKPIEEIMIVI